MTITDLNTWYKQSKESSLFGRYIHLKNIAPLINNLPSNFVSEVIGTSVLGENIYSITLGNGPKKILMWSQMHGNESTTTKAIFDLLNSFKNNNLDNILKACTIKIIPMLNPDGAKAYTRLNANNVDLNRDARVLSQPESKVLLDCYNAFKPDYCFNLHGQRTIFSAGNTNNVATLSFLSPSENEERDITTTRKKAMQIIVAINNMMQNQLPNQIGRYDDSFNVNCVGDSFQMQQTPTILYETGHYKNDYDREEVRYFAYQALIAGLSYIANNTITGSGYESYFEIPENQKLFYDIIIKEALIEGEVFDIGIQYQEKLIDSKLYFKAKVEKIFKNESFFAHKWIKANKLEVKTVKNETLFLGYENDFVLINNVKKSLKH